MNDFIDRNSSRPDPSELRTAGNDKIIRLVPKWPKDMNSSNGHEFLRMITDPDLIQHKGFILGVIFGPQIEEVFEDAGQRFLSKAPEGIGFRGILASSEGNVDFKGLGVKDLDTIAAEGTETGMDATNVSAQSEPGKTSYLDHHRVTQYLTGWVPKILESNDPKAKKLIPAILVYDLSKFNHKGGYVVEFKDKRNKSESLLAVYPIDISPLLEAAVKP